MDAATLEAPFERGIYALTELTRFVAIRHRHPHTADQVARWLERGLGKSDHRSRRPDYSFHDLVSLFVVRELIDTGVRLADIAQAEEHLRAQLDFRRPFASIHILTDGVDVLYDANPHIIDQLTAANRSGQEVLRPTIEAALRDVHYEGTVAARWTPWRAIVIDPAVQFGEPCIAGTRITTERLAHLNAAGDSPRRLAEVFDIPKEYVAQALEFERELASAV
jgi:uncharacterized protein (DUF433 family)/DNA-binding transcriptional MerR regulator